MARVERTKVVDLGTLAVQQWSEAIDMRSFTHAVLFIECPTFDANGTNIIIDVEFSPQPYGEASDWFAMYSPVSFQPIIALSPNPIVLCSREKDQIGSPLYEKNRAYPIMPMDAFSFLSSSGFEAGCGEYLLPSQMRIRCNDYALATKVMLGREIE